ncbi:hypothetical protein SGFS_029970 [Streptomyces graminofaciens]|uniref:Coenzyme Q-binding protein COQ10 START domain-containing protein n=1 Tax=Streptomyces graminofaciens TaxID=68212 RepID=A0ABN5VEC7_9ACTN|nr:SRPBCC family protein [Streptomyces graminofaciens]BBC31703.1 hypothetical protein SGFS_029970 [Streptomyces graminofaciens]
MAEGTAAKGGSAGAGTLTKAREQARQNPGAVRLKEELEHYVEARLELMLQGVGHGLGEGARRLSEADISPLGLVTAVGRGGKKLLERMPSGEVLSSTASHTKDAVVDTAKGVTEKAKDVTGMAKDVTEKKHGRQPEGGVGRGLTVIEDIDVGAPVSDAYDQWMQFRDFERFAKGVVDVEQEDETTITEQVPDERIAWTTEGEKATTKGVVTFHPLGENLTKVLLVLEYLPKGMVERVGGLVRPQGRRARLDLKLYRKFVMMRGEATGGSRGEIHEGEMSDEEDDEDDENDENDEEEDEEEVDKEAVDEKGQEDEADEDDVDDLEDVEDAEDVESAEDAEDAEDVEDGEDAEDGEDYAAEEDQP